MFHILNFFPIGEAQAEDSGAAMDEGLRQRMSDKILEAGDLEDGEDVEMIDAEEGELLEIGAPPTEVGKCSGGDLATEKRGPQSKNQNRRARKKRNKRKSDGSVPKPVDINRFVLDACRRLREKKSYLVYTAVGCLGVSAFSDLIGEVDAIQACGGQMTADGKCYRTGGGILWKVIKAREPAAYREIMKKAKEFEKQFQQQNTRHILRQNDDGYVGETGLPSTTTRVSTTAQDDSQFVPHNQPVKAGSEVNRKSIRERIRVPASYDDLCGEDTNAESI